MAIEPQHQFLAAPDQQQLRRLNIRLHSVLQAIGLKHQLLAHCMDNQAEYSTAWGELLQLHDAKADLDRQIRVAMGKAPLDDQLGDFSTPSPADDKAAHNEAQLETAQADAKVAAILALPRRYVSIAIDNGKLIESASEVNERAAAAAYDLAHRANTSPDLVLDILNRTHRFDIRGDGKSQPYRLVEAVVPLADVLTILNPAAVK